jgi:putative ABC transport system permease protein
MLIRVRRAALRSWVSLALLLAVVGGAVLALGAGARRTDSAYPRFLATSNASDVFVMSNSGANDQRALLAEIARLPQVARAGVVSFIYLVGATPSGGRLGFDINAIGLPDARYGRSIDRFKVLEGRLADPGRTDQVTVSFPLADNFHLHVGDVLRFRGVRQEDLAAAAASGLADPDIFAVAKGAERRVRITGIIASPAAGDFPPLTQSGGSVYFTPAFFEQASSNLVTSELLAVKLRHGQDDAPAFGTAAQRLASGQQVQIQFQTAREHEAVVQSALHLQALGLGLLSALGAAVLLLVLGQGVARRIALDATDHAALRALGATRPQLWAAAMARAALATVAGAAGAVGVAIALSPLTPLGDARAAEPDPGIHLDPTVVLGGGAALVLSTLVLAALPAWQAAGSGAGSTARQGGSRLAAWLSQAAFPTTVVAGVRLALEPGRGRSSVPVRGAITACALAAATAAGALTFTASLDHLLHTPLLYGWNWDAEVSQLQNGEHAAATIAAIPSVAAAVQGTGADMDVGPDHVTAVAMEPVKGAVEPVVVSGRAAQADDEILLGSQTDAGARLGQRVTVRLGDASQQMRLVGRGVIPILGDTSRLGIGAWMTYGGLRRLLGDGTPPPDTYLIRYGADRNAAGAALVQAFGPGVQLPQPPTGLVNFGGVSALPLVLGGVLAAGAIATLAHAVATSVQRRRRDLAILKTLGFVRLQVVGAVAWQTTTIATFAALVGVPIGAAAGRWAWTLFAGQQGMVSEPVVPVWSLLLLLPGALLLANLVAAIPGRIAARTSPALVLRAE